MFLVAFALVTATPSSFPAALAAAAPGTTIKLAPGDYGIIDIQGRKFAPPITVDARQANLSAFNVTKSSGVKLLGGKISGGNALGYDVLVRQSQKVDIRGTFLTGAKRGIVVDRSQDVTLAGNTLRELTIDGIDIGLSQRVLIENNDCASNSTGKAHPDCIQAWSRPGNIISDLVIRNNKVSGNVQGITLFNHVRNGVNDGGYDRVSITGNTVQTLYPQGIHAGDVRGLTIRNNDVSSLPGARFKTQINVSRSTGDVCDNRVKDLPRSPATERCPAR